jgi:phospho-N-acetylmuramoyl-pentapeptide-transferase
MLYYLFKYLDEHFSLPGAGVFQYISFRAALAIITSLVISLLMGKSIIRLLHRMQVGETVRDLGLTGQKEKQGTPTMGGLIIIAAILIPTLLFARLMNVYVILMLVTTIWLGLIGFLDDYIKVFKKDKEGLAGRFKILGQVGLGLIVGITLYLNPNVVVKEKLSKSQILVAHSHSNVIEDIRQSGDVLYSQQAVKSTKTTIPFVKNHEFDYAELLRWMGDGFSKWSWLIFIPVVILIITAVSNGANLGILAYVSGNTVFANYLNIMYIPYTGELVVFMAAFVGACVGFLWYNAYPAQVFMGDTGSLALGGIIATFAIAIRKELLIPVLCGIFLVENLSVVMQVSYFKYTKKKYGEGRRIFKMSPLHHHYQKLGYHESKIVSRFWIIGIMLAIVAVITLKLR